MNISLKDILPDHSLAYRDSLHQWPNGQALVQSIRRMGLLQPVTLFERQDGLQPVAGFRRLTAAQILKLDHLPAIVLPADETISDGFLKAVEDHAGQTYNLREKAHALQVTKHLGWSVKEICDKLMPALGLSPQPHLVEQHLKLLTLPPCLLDLFLQKGYSLRRCLPYCQCASEEVQILASVAEHLSLGGSQIEEVYTALLEIARRDGQTLAQVVDELDLLNPLDPKQTHSEIMNALLRLERRRLPETCKRREELDKLCLNFAGGEVKVRYDKNFSRSAVELILTIESSLELSPKLKRLQESDTQVQLKSILEKI